MASGVMKKGTKWKALRDIRKFDEDFNIESFPELAQEIYNEAHTLLTTVFPRNFMSEYSDDTDYYRLHELLTELGWPAMTSGLDNKTLVWRMVESLEAPQVVHVVCKEAKKPDNRYAQITVRFHNTQIMALYDRFGRLLHGSETVTKDVLDYIVFEKHLTDSYGTWRIHGKIRPQWETPAYDFVKTLAIEPSSSTADADVVSDS